MLQSKLSLREKKYATLKLKILDTFIIKLKDKRLADISVKEIAKELEISEMTVFNYFSSKKELLVYFIELWSLQMQQAIKGQEPIEAIYTIFKESAKIIEQNPNLFMEIIASMALYGMYDKNIEIGRAERVIRFGENLPYEVGGFIDVVMPILDNLNLSEDKKKFIYTALVNTFFGTPMRIKCQDFTNLEATYIEQLDYILKGIK